MTDCENSMINALFSLSSYAYAKGYDTIADDLLRLSDQVKHAPIDPQLRRESSST